MKKKEMEAEIEKLKKQVEVLETHVNFLRLCVDDVLSKIAYPYKEPVIYPPLYPEWTQDRRSYEIRFQNPETTCNSELKLKG